MGSTGQDGAYCVVTVDARTRAILRVGIYSAPAEGLTSVSQSETMLNGPRVEYETSYSSARKRLLEILHRYPNYRWLYEMLPIGDRV
jgi:hypothetical protein